MQSCQINKGRMMPNLVDTLEKHNMTMNDIEDMKEEEYSCNNKEPDCNKCVQDCSERDKS